MGNKVNQTITLDYDVLTSFKLKVGDRNISRTINDLIKSYADYEDKESEHKPIAEIENDIEELNKTLFELKNNLTEKKRLLLIEKQKIEEQKKEEWKKEEERIQEGLNEIATIRNSGILHEALIRRPGFKYD